MKEWTPCRITYDWLPVEIAPGKPLTYPCRLTKSFVASYSKPALYRWAFRDKKREITAIYIGEAENLVGRVRKYISSGRNRQARRMRDAFLNHNGLGGAVELQTLKFEPFGINTVNVYNESQLANPYIRKMMENLLLADNNSVRYELKNCVENPIERRRRKSMRASAAAASSTLGDFSSARAVAEELRREGKF